MATEINKEKLKALQLTMDKMEKTFGKGAIMRLGESGHQRLLHDHAPFDRRGAGDPLVVVINGSPP